MDARAIARVAGWGRVVSGAWFVLAPRSAGRPWHGREHGEHPTVRVLSRSMGIRDVLIGQGILRSLDGGDDAELRRWLGYSAVADGADLYGMVMTRRELHGPTKWFSLAGAAGAIATALVARQSLD